MKLIWALWKQSEAMKFWNICCSLLPWREGITDRTVTGKPLVYLPAFSCPTISSLHCSKWTPPCCQCFERKKSWICHPFVWYFYIQFGHPPAVEERKYGRPLVRCWWSATVDSWRARAWDVAAHKGCIITISTSLSSSLSLLPLS